MRHFGSSDSYLPDHAYWSMKVGLLGATGNVGGEFLRLALDNGHEARDGAFFDRNHGERVRDLAFMT